MNGFKKFMLDNNLKYETISKLTNISERTLKRYVNEGLVPKFDIGRKIIRLIENYTGEKIDQDTFFGE